MTKKKSQVVDTPDFTDHILNAEELKIPEGTVPEEEGGAE